MSDDPYTMELRLCDDQGMVSNERQDGADGPGTGATYLEALRFLQPTDRQYEGEPFVCTGHAHLSGEHIRCTSPAHDRVREPSAKRQINDEGEALIRIARELREFVDDVENVPPSLHQDIATVDRVGQWLSRAVPIEGAIR